MMSKTAVHRIWVLLTGIALVTTDLPLPGSGLAARLGLGVPPAFACMPGCQNACFNTKIGDYPIIAQWLQACSFTPIPQLGNLACVDMDSIPAYQACLNAVCPGFLTFAAANNPECFNCVVVSCESSIREAVTSCSATYNSTDALQCPATFCGNGILEGPDEECDDGDAVEGNGCDTNCTTSRCGNGVVASGEQCDDGNTAAGDCCSATCTFSADPCDDGDLCTGPDVCSAGTCAAGEAVSCDDSNPCTQDSCDPMTGCANKRTPVDTGCLVAPKTKLQIRDSTDDTKDKLSWQWGSGDAFLQSVLGTPSTDTGYALCVYDTTASVPSLVAAIPINPSASLWTSKAPKGLLYKDRAGASGGVTLAQLKTGSDGRTKVKLSAKGASLPLSGPVGSTYFSQSPSVVVQLVNDVGTCWTSTFASGDTTTNVADAFKAQTK